MSTLPGPNNAIAYAQFRLQGGWRGTVIMAAACLTLLAGLLAMGTVSAVAHGLPPASAARDWPQGLVLLQVLFLLVIGPLRVTSAVRADITSRMLESHRLMPLPPAAAVLGYAAGGPWAAIVLAFATFAFGSASALAAGLDPSAFLAANLVLALTAACVWVAATYLSMASRFGVLVLVVLAVFAVTGVDGGPAELVPGMEVLTAPLVSRSALVLSGRAFSVAPAVFAFAAQLALSALCFRAAVRLYRSPGAMGMTPVLSLGVLAVWVVTSILGLAEPTMYGMRVHSRSGLTPADQLVASTVAALVLAAAPLSAAVRADRIRRRSPGDPDAVPVLLTPLMALACWAIVTALPVLASGFMEELPFVRLVTPTHLVHEVVISPALVRHAQLCTAAVVLAAVSSITFVLKVAHRGLERAWFVLSVWAFLTWVVPLIADAVVSTDPEGRFGAVASVSPIGALVEVWGRADASVGTGIGLQFVVAAVPAVLYGTSAAAGLRRRAVTAGSPA